MFESIRKRIATSLLPSSVKQRQAVNPFDVASFHMSGMPIYSDMSVRKAVREGYRLSVYVYRCVRTIVQAASGIPWYVEKDGEPVENHMFTQTWAHPNPHFSGQSNMEIVIAHRRLVGNALIQPLIVNGIPREFWMCMPDMIKPIPSDIPGEWLKGWEISPAQGGKIETVPPEQFIHLMQIDPGNFYWGIGDLQAAARTVDTDNEAQDTQKVQLQNRNVPPGVFQFDQALGDEQFDEATKRIREKFLQKSQRGEPWVLGGGYKWQSMALTPQEMDYIKSRINNKRDIATAFGLDPWWVGDREHSTYNNVREARQALYEDTVIPMLDDLRSDLNLRVSPMYPDNPYITYDLSNISALREDEDKKSEIAKRYFDMGVPFEKVNEKLNIGFEEFEGWGESYLPVNLLPAGSAGNIPDESQPAKMLTKALNLANEEQKTIHWKRIDRRRQAWWNVVQKRVQPLYEAEGKSVVKACEGAAPDKLASVAEKAINAAGPDWEKIIKAVGTVMVEDFGNDTAEDLGGKPKSMMPTEGKWEYDPATIAIRTWLSEHAAESVKSILSTNLGDVRRVIAAGVDEGLTVPQIGSRLRNFYADQNTYKAMRVARTEVSRAAGYGQRAAAKQSGVAVKKTWISSRDDRVREEHAAVDGETIGIDERYSNGEMYPGEKSINCRCAEGYRSK